jgi:hypothetical protein
MSEEEKAMWGGKMELLRRVKAWIDDPDHLEPPVEAIAQRFYVWVGKEEGDVFFAKHMNRQIIRRMMSAEGAVTCYWGGFKKHFVNPYGELMHLTPIVNTRTPCKTSWWSTCSRFFLPDASDMDLSYPKGYEMDEDERQFNSLLREDVF